MSKPVIYLYCPKGFSSDAGQRVSAYLGKANVSGPLARLWNAWWDLVDPVADEDGAGLHQAQRLGFDQDERYMVVNAGESFGLGDFAACLEDVVRLEVVCRDRKPLPE